LSDPRMLISAPAEASRARVLAPNVDQAWRWIGWFSLVLALAGIGDWVLAWIPLRFGNTEWEFATIVSTFSALPLVTMGLAGLAGSAVARGIRWQLIAVGTIVLVWGLLILVALLLFLLDVPIALKMVQGPPRLGIMKATAKTVMLGGLFSVVYFGIGIQALRRSRVRK
jgi:magnesium-transporting ATPase (P-type)